MQLKSSEYLKEAIRTNDEQLRYKLMAKACKQISQILPFQQMWNILLKQENIFFYMLMLQSMFGQNIKMLLELIIERFSGITQFQIQFLNACKSIFQQDYKQLSFFIQQNIGNIFKECIIQLQCFIRQIPKNDSKEGVTVAEQIIGAYKTIFGNIHDNQVTMELFSSLQNVTNKWPLITEIDPLIFHEVQDIIGNRTPRNYDAVLFYDDITECDSPIKSNSIRKDNQIVVELQRWLSKMNHIVPVISKRIGSSVINSQNMFKLRENIEIILSFIYSPLKYEIAHCWSRVQLPKISLKDMPNFRDAINIQGSPSIYHIRSIRALQCLMDDENHGIIAKINSSYLKIAFTYLYESYQEDEGKHTNFNHVALLLESYLQKEQDITVFYTLHFNLPHILMLNLQYDQVCTFLTHFLLQPNPFGQQYTQKQASLYDQCWKYFQASLFFHDLIDLLLTTKNKETIQSKCCPEYRNIEMMQTFTLQPDFKLRESVTDFQDQLYHLTEENVHLQIDIDLLKPFIQKKTIKSFSFFRKVSSKLLPSNPNFQNPALMEVIRGAIEEAAIQEAGGPMKKRFRRTTLERERIIVLRSASIVTFDDEDFVKEETPINNNNNSPMPLIHLETHQSDNRRSVSQQTIRNKMERKRNVLLYPLSLKDITNNEIDNEYLEDRYSIEKEAFTYNGIQFLSVLIQQLIYQEQIKLKRLSYICASEQYLSIILLENNCQLFDKLMKFYLFKIKLSPFLKENSAIICGKLVNLIITKLPLYCCLQDNAPKYLEFICKLLISSFDWRSSTNTIEIDVAKLLLIETMIELVQSQINHGYYEIINKITPTTWSCFIELCKISKSKPNFTFYNLFTRLLKITMNHGSEYNIHTIFMKLNFLSSIKQLAETISNNSMQNPKTTPLIQFIHAIVSIVQQQIQKPPQKDSIKAIASLIAWKQLKQIFNIRDHKHANSFYSSVDQSRVYNSTPATNQSLARIRIRKSAQSITNGKQE